METKICSKPVCSNNGEPQPLNNFNKEKRSKDGLRSSCRECDKKYSKEKRYHHKEEYKQYRKKYYENNSDRLKGNTKK